MALVALLVASLPIGLRSIVFAATLVAASVGISHAQPAVAWSQSADAGLGRGVTVRSADGEASLTIRARAQLRGSYLDVAGTRQSQFDAMLRRMRVVFTGDAMGPRLTYYVQLGFANLDMEPDLRVPLRDAYVTWAPARDAHLRVGQMKVPFGRQRVVSSSALQMVDRSISVAELNLDRDVGLRLFSDDLFGLNNRLGYSLGIFGGDGRNRTGRAAGLLYVARAFVQPLGVFDDEQEADLDRTPSPRVRVGGGVAYNQNTNRPRSTTGLPYPTGTFDYTHLGLDAAAKHRGLSLSGELLYRRADRDRLEALSDGTPVTLASRSGWGGYIQAGRMVSERVEVTGCYGRILPRRGTDPSLVPASELGGGVSFYPRRQDLKLQADYFHLGAEDDEPDGRQLRIQLQVFF
jgi:phosphate-selective porin OprO and OprP